jgi:negative regulator of flagellin synthesis FlgM
MPAVVPPSEVSPIAASPAVAAPRSTGSAAPAPTKSETDALNTALAQIRGLPVVDQVQVATLRNQLESGDIPFDASKLAALIERYHRTGQ